MTIFKMPVPVTIMGRSSSITNSFVNGIVPFIEPTDAEIDAALEVLGMNRETIRCAYCGDRHTEWDHLNPLVVDKAPTGYISEIHNLVPACGKCNQSKGNSNWREWITGSAKLSPRNRGVTDLEERIRRLDAYEKTFSPARIDFIELAGESEWAEYWSSYEDVIASMKKAQKISVGMKSRILAKLDFEKKERTAGVEDSRFRRSNDPLEIRLIPADKSQFERELLAYRKARIDIYYKNGKVESKEWNAFKFSETSDVFNNLRTRPEFRPGVWQANGIDYIVVSIIKGA